MPDKPIGFNPELLSYPPQQIYPPHHHQHPHHHHPPPFQPPHYPPPHHNCPPPHHNYPHGGGHGNKGYYWIHSNAYSGLPPSAVVGGQDQDGTTIYVGRAFHEGDYIPAKVIPQKTVAYVAYEGKEHAKYEYEVLVEQRFEWQSCCGGNVPPNAVDGGRTSDGETLYVGRTYHDGAHTVGKVHPSHGCLYIPFGGEELRFDSYEILVML